MTAFTTGAFAAIAMATLTYFAMQAGTVTMVERFAGPNVHLQDYQATN
ncbi:hypothetical protein [Loktanella sp. R86503]